jgi:hypothetical protein
LAGERSSNNLSDAFAAQRPYLIWISADTDVMPAALFRRGGARSGVGIKVVRVESGFQDVTVKDNVRSRRWLASWSRWSGDLIAATNSFG